MERPTLTEIREHSFFKCFASPNELPEYLLFKAPICPGILIDELDFKTDFKAPLKKRKHDDAVIENGFLNKKSKHL